MMDHFSSSARDILTDEGDWQKTPDNDAYARNRKIWEEYGLPTLGQENWRYTPIAARLKEKKLVAPSKPDSFADIENILIAIPDTIRLVFINGYFIPELSPELSYDKLSNNVELRESDERENKLPNAEKHALAALNAIAQHKTTTLEIAKNISVEKPIHIACFTKGENDDGLVFATPRLNIIMQAFAEMTVLETHQGNAHYFTNGMTLCSLGEGAQLRHYVLQDDAMEAFHTGFTTATLAANAHYQSFVAQKGALLARRDIYVVLQGEGAEVTLNGLYHVDGKRHIDNATRIDHIAPHCLSSEEYRGVAEGSGKGVFQGKILVCPEAQKTEGYQMSRALLLSPTAEINHKPELEIYADDVKCSHGSTVSTVDQAQLFYLKTRGLDEERAQKMLLQGFLAEIIDTVSDDALAAFFRKIFNLDTLSEI